MTADDGRIWVRDRRDIAADSNRAAMAAGITLVDLHHVAATLEVSFLENAERPTS